MKKLLFVSYYWPPSGGPGVQRAVKFVKYLPDNGIEPVVVTVRPGQASYPLTDTSLAHDIPETIRVIRTKSFEPLRLYSLFSARKKLPSPGFAGADKPGLLEKAWRFARGNLFIPDARKGWNAHAIRACARLLQEDDYHAVLTTSPPHSSQLIGLSLQQRFGIPWVADLRDPWTDIYYNRELYRLRCARGKDARLEKTVLEKANAIITVSDSLKELFASKSPGIDPDKIHVIPNGFDPDDFNMLHAGKDSHREATRPFVIGYTGTMSDAYPVAGFIQAVLQFLLEHPSADVKIRFTGQLSKGAQDAFRNAGLTDKLIVQGHVDHGMAVQQMAAADLLLLIIPDVLHNEGILTGKLFEYLASRRPILGFGPAEGDAANIIRRCQGGRLFDYRDTAGAASWISFIYKQVRAGINPTAGNEYIERYNRKEQTGVLASLIDITSHTHEI